MLYDEPTSLLDLDSYYHLIDMETRRRGDDESAGGGGGGDDLHAQLAQKDTDLILAAELGKALLDRNEELNRKNELLADEYTQVIDELEQEKHALRLRLESLETEYENTVKELQLDISQLRQELHRQQTHSTAGDRDKLLLIQDLTGQNEVLTEQVRKIQIERALCKHQSILMFNKGSKVLLKIPSCENIRDGCLCAMENAKHMAIRFVKLEEEQASETEKQLLSQSQGLQEMLVSRQLSMHNDVHQLEVLQEQIQSLSKHKTELERKIATLREERDALGCSIEESQDRILMLEKQKLEQEQQIRNQRREIHELREVNCQLQAQLKNLSQRSSHSSIECSQTLFSELSRLSGEREDDLSPGTQGESLGYISSQSLVLMDLTDEDDIECDDVPIANSTANCEAYLTANTEDSLQFQELLDVYRHLRQMCIELWSKSKHSSCNSAADFNEVPANLCPGELFKVTMELQMLIQELLDNRQKVGQVEDSGSLADSDSSVSVSESEDLFEKMHEMHQQLSQMRDQLTRLHADLQIRDQQLCQKDEALTELTDKMVVYQKELCDLTVERDNLQDQALGQLSRDEVIDQARKDRNEAIRKKNKLEGEVAKAKIEILSLNSHLMEAIQQKVTVSQQLDMWQVDMEEMIDIQMRKRIHQEAMREQVVEELKLQLKSKSKKHSSFFSRGKNK